MPKFRLAVFNTQPPHLYAGGVERRIMETTRRLTEQAYITVYCGTKAGFKQPSQIGSVKIAPIHSTDKLFPLDNWVFNRSLTKATASIQADVYEAHAVSGYGFLEALKKQGTKKPFVHTIHGVLADEYEQAKQNGYTSSRDRLANYFLHELANHEKQTAQDATLIVTISQYSLGKIKQHYGVDGGKVRIVPNGVDPEKFKPQQDKASARRQLGLGNEPCVLFVGNLIPRKGLGFLVEAAKKIVEQQAETKFVIVGEGPLKSQLQSTLAVENLAGNFKFMGKIDEALLPVMYSCSDVFVLPSIQEGQGIVLLEAQACGLPVVAFDIGGVNEAVKNGETGFLAKRGNTKEMADVILRLLSDRSLREKIGGNGRQFVVGNFTWDICAQKMLRIYEEALGN